MVELAEFTPSCADWIIVEDYLLRRRLIQPANPGVLTPTHFVAEHLMSSHQAHLVSPLAAANPLVEEFKRCYATFGTDTIAELQKVYDPAVVFVDPLHRVEGWAELERYFAASALNLHYCRFEFIDSIVSHEAAFFKWQMQYAHRKIARGKALSLVGATQIKFGQFISYHEDFYDLGAMVYQHIPVLGLGIQKLRHCMLRASRHGR